MDLIVVNLLIYQLLNMLLVKVNIGSNRIFTHEVRLSVCLKLVFE